MQEKDLLIVQSVKVITRLINYNWLSVGVCQIVSDHFIICNQFDQKYQNKGGKKQSTVMILSFRTDTPGQTMQTQIRLLLEEQSDLGLHCLQYPLHLLDALL